MENKLHEFLKQKLVMFLSKGGGVRTIGGSVKLIVIYLIKVMLEIYEEIKIIQSFLLIE